MSDYRLFLHENAPEVILTLASILVLFTDFALVRRRSLALRSSVAACTAIAGCIAAAIWLVHPATFVSADGGVLMEGSASITILGLLAVTAGVLLLSSANNFTDHPAEFNFLTLLATIGMMVLIHSGDLLTFFLSLELLSLSLYAITGFNKNNSRSSEAALKYFLFGGISAAFLLFGFSFLYGVSGEIYFQAIYAAAQAHPLSPLLIVGIVCTLIGFGFKVAAAPFHFWAPDAYEGAPAPAAAFIASSSKIASFAAFYTLIASTGLASARGSAAWGHMRSGWQPIVAGLAIVSMLLGNLTALRQTGLRRLIAYSAVAHAGYILLSFIAGSPQAPAALNYYVITYAIGTVGVFAIISTIETADGSDALTNFNGLYRRSPILAACLFIFMLSLAGIPPLSGFFAKFYVFLAVLEAPGHLWLVVIALATSAVALYYYLQVLKRAFLLPAEPHAQPLRPHPALLIVAVITAAAVVLLGIMPRLLLSN